jgi:hypothetical protein
VEREVHVLVVSMTGAGLSDVAYNLRRPYGTMLIGETTAGCARRGDVLRLSEHLAAFTPTTGVVGLGAAWQCVGRLAPACARAHLSSPERDGPATYLFATSLARRAGRPLVPMQMHKSYICIACCRKVLARTRACAPPAQLFV